MTKPFFAPFILLFLLATSADAIPRYFEFEGRITTPKKSGCDQGRAELFIAEAGTGTLIYQVDVIHNGSFGFKLKPGKYQVRAVTESGCEGVYGLDGTSGKSVVRDVVVNKKKDDEKKDEKL